MEQMPQPLPVTLTGQMAVLAARLEVNEVEVAGVKRQAIIVYPAGTGFQIVIPLEDKSAKFIGGKLLAKRVLLPDQNGKAT